MQSKGYKPGIIPECHEEEVKAQRKKEAKAMTTAEVLMWHCEHHQHDQCPELESCEQTPETLWTCTCRCHAEEKEPTP